MESYKTPARRASATITEKKSDFIALCAPVAAESEALAVLDEARRAHRTAAHNVYAYTLREGARQRYSDDGEPAKTAGLPVLEAIHYADMVDCIVVVTRYFGGTLLGTGGLVRAYTAAAKAGLAAAGTSVVQRCKTVALTVEYPLYEPARRLILQAGASLAEPEFAAKVSLCATLPAAGAAPLAEALRELCRGSGSIQVSAGFYAPFQQEDGPA